MRENSNIAGGGKAFEIDPPGADYDRDSWMLFQSDYSRYLPKDFFLHYALWNPNKGSVMGRIVISIVWLLLSAAFLATLIAAVGLIPLPMWLVAHEEIFTPEMSVALTAALLVAWSLWRAGSSRYRGDQESETSYINFSKTYYFVQIIPSVGSLRFNFGSRGLLVQAGTAQYSVEWAAVAKTELYGEPFRLVEEVDDANYLALYLKTHNFRADEGWAPSGCLVIPKHFLIPV